MSSEELAKEREAFKARYTKKLEEAIARCRRMERDEQAMRPIWIPRKRSA